MLWPLSFLDVQEDYEIVSKEDCRPEEASGDRLQMYSKLEKDLLEQYKLCKENRAHFKATAEIGSANKFQQMMEHTKKDIDTLRYVAKYTAKRSSVNCWNDVAFDRHYFKQHHFRLYLQVA